MAIDYVPLNLQWIFQNICGNLINWSKFRHVNIYSELNFCTLKTSKDCRSMK